MAFNKEWCVVLVDEFITIREPTVLAFSMIYEPYEFSATMINHEISDGAMIDWPKTSYFVWGES